MISQRSVYPHIDIDACTRLGVIVSSNMHADTPSYAAAELTWGLILAAMRQIPRQVAALLAAGGRSASGTRFEGKRSASTATGASAAPSPATATAFGMRVLVWAREASRCRAADDGYAVATSREAFYEESDIVSLHMRLVRDARQRHRRAICHG